jgi:DNA-binding transcriptional LysR family regulator
MNFRQLSTFVGIYEDGSFNKAARRLNATQSGLSVQIRNLEETLGTPLFERSAKGVQPTLAGRRLYAAAVDILRQLDRVGSELRDLSGQITGPLRVGLMPTFTRGLLAPVMSGYMAEHPNVEVSVVEAYSAVLVDKVAEGEVDFAVVPRSAEREGIRARPLGEDREILVTKAGGRLAHLEPARLADLPPLHLVLPAKGNARRDRLDQAFDTMGVKVASIIAMDAMIATLDFVASSDYATILPQTICGKDLDGRLRWLHPIIDPVLTVGYSVIEPARRAPTPAANAFLERLEAEYRRSGRQWDEIIASLPRR